MCAINGFNFNSRELILKMNKITSHRGPDGTGIFCADGISLGHNRLSIIDLDTRSAQPMKGSDDNSVIVFNGEIYNYQDLKTELKEYTFKTASDTEVILAAYKRWGSSCVKKFNGIFAFAIWDAEKQEIFLARDHVGIKPLYYFNKDKKFIFSSEIKGILEHNIFRVLNREAFNHYFRVLYAPEPLTMFEGIYKLPPASYAIFRDGELKITKYWEPETNKYTNKTKKEIAEELREKVLNSVTSQLVSDRPLGIYLSGGIDSSVVLDCVSKIRNKIDTFSVGFELVETEQREKFNKDFELARMTARNYKTNHHEVLLSAEEVPGLLEEAVWQMDEPISNPTALAMLKLAKFAKEKVYVVLGGDGGDELFGGYERYRLSFIADIYQKLPFFLRKRLNFLEKFNKLNTPPGIERFALFMFQKNKVLERVVNKKFLFSEVTRDFFSKKYFSDNPGNSTERLMKTDRSSWLVDFSLALTDKMSMSAALEARVPLLDRDLVEFSLSIPLSYKVNLFNTKIILKEAFKGIIPNFLFNQPKRGWFSPGAKWLRRPEMQEMVKSVLSPRYHKEIAVLFNWKEIDNIVINHKSGKEYNLNVIWAILTFQIWAKMYDVKI